MHEGDGRPLLPPPIPAHFGKHPVLRRQYKETEDNDPDLFRYVRVL